MTKEISSVSVIGRGIMGSGTVLTFTRGGSATAVLRRDPSRVTDAPAGA